jgi:hypothetical protein
LPLLRQILEVESHHQTQAVKVVYRSAQGQQVYWL